uniref:Uncharacterized protein n=1 Tax=Schistosoma haematobium TaxID=6185 RepID=A0A094ZQK8_SCHHA
MTFSINEFLSLLVEITEYQDVPSIKAAEMFYKTCTEALSVKNEFITTKVIDLIELLFSGWLMSSDDTQQYNLIEKFLRSRKFNLTASILPLIFQGGRTTLFSLNLIGDYSQEDNSMIYVQEKTAIDEDTLVSISDLEQICPITYKETLSGNTESLNERKMFFSAFARVSCADRSNLV